MARSAEVNDAPLLVQARNAGQVGPIELDPEQQRVVDHRDGPLLVLAGPGTGKTTTIVELVARRVEREGLRPEQVLVLTFSRRAADELRMRLAARLQRTVHGRLAWTFHAWCYAVLREFDVAGADSTALRLLSGPEQDVVVRDLLRSHREPPPGGVSWPDEWRPLIGLRGFAEEVRDLLARCQERGVGPTDLDVLGARTGRSAWQTLAPFYREYLQILDWEGAVDYAGLVLRTARLLEEPDVLARVAGELRLVVVDEYQDTDPAQERVLRALASTGAQLVVVGDPDQSIYAFRGADVSGILQFSDRFRGPGRGGRPGRRAKVLTLGTCRRSGPGLVAASRAVARRLPLPGLDVPSTTAHRRLAAAGPAEDPAVPVVQIRLFPSPAQEAVAVADIVRRAHLIEGVPWSAMAVLVRSTRLAGPLQRALANAGVPVETPIDERPLMHEPTLEPLLALLGVGTERDELDEDTAVTLLASPLGGADALQLRLLRRELHARERATGGNRRSGELLVRCLTDRDLLSELAAPVRAAPQRIADALDLVRAGVAAGDSPEQVLWTTWKASHWSAQLEDAVRHPVSPAVRRHADRQLDVVMALFEAAARFVDRLPASGLLVFLEGLSAQEIPADPLTQRAFQADAVRLLTAHRSKGLEWDLVIVPGVQDGAWPDLRRRSTLLEGDALATADETPTLFAEDEQAVAARASALVDERRLFYVAVTRARRRLVVTAASGGEDAELRPSRFLAELGVPMPEQPEPAPRVLALPALVAELRCTASDPHASPALRAAAAAELAELSAAEVSAADPDSWWGFAEWTDRRLPMLPADGAVVLSPSQVEVINACPLKWFLVRRAGVAAAGTAAQGFGVLVHDIAKRLAQDEITNAAELEAALDEHWPSIDWEAPWFSASERAVAGEALRRLRSWHQGRPNQVVGVELDFDLPLDLQAGRAQIRGQIDRLERDADGRAYVVDYKTSRQKPSGGSARDSPQLGLYQLAATGGAVSLGKEEGAEPGAVTFTGTAGAALLPLRHQGEVTQPPLQPGGDGRTWVHELLEGLVAAIAAERFPARRNEDCQRCPVRRSCPAQPEGASVV